MLRGGVYKPRTWPYADQIAELLLVAEHVMAHGVRIPISRAARSESVAQVKGCFWFG